MEPGANRPFDLHALGEAQREAAQATDLNQLKAIFYRLEEIVRRYPGDAEIAAYADQVRVRIRERGAILQQQQGPLTSSGLPPVAPVPGELPPPVYPADVPPPLPPPAPMTAAPPAPAARTFNWKLPILGGGLIGLLLFGGALVIWKKPFSKPAPPVQQPQQAPAALAVTVKTDPPGAQIAVDGQVRCTSDCSVELPPGDHQVTAALAGFENEAAALSLKDQPGAVNLKLRPLPPSVRVVSNLEGWKVSLDDAPMVEFQDGLWSMDRMAPGKHTLRVTGRTGEARFAVTIPDAPGAAPQIDSVTANNVFALALAEGVNEARIRTSEPSTVQVEGQPPVALKAEAVELPGIPPGEKRVTIGEGKEQRSVLLTFSPAASLSIHLLQNATTGALVVLTGEDNAQVFLDNKVQRRQTAKGVLRIYNLEPKQYTVRVAKDGFESVPEQKVTVKRGEETKVDFKLKALPKVSALHLRGAQPGAQVLVAGNPVGTVAQDGTLTANNIAPGDQVVEIRAQGFSPKQVTRRFVPGQTLELGGADVALSRATGVLTIASISPPEAEVTVRRAGDPAVTTVDRNRKSYPLPEGTYTLSARAQGYEPISREVQITAGRERTFNIELVKQRAATPAPSGGMDGWEAPGEWTKQEQWWVHQPSNAPVLYKAVPSDGTFTFTVTLLKGRGVVANRPIRWMADYRGPGDFVQYEINKKEFTRRVFRGGAGGETLRIKHGMDKQNTYSVRMKVENGGVSVRAMKEGGWELLDELKEAGRNFGAGKFGFLVREGEVLGLSNFTFGR